MEATHAEPCSTRPHAPYREPPPAVTVAPAQRTRALLPIAAGLVASAALVVALGALHLASTLLGLAPFALAARPRVTSTRSEARLDAAVTECARRNQRPLFIAPGLEPGALRRLVEPGGLGAPLRETIRALDAYAAVDGLWLHEVDGVLRLEREVTSVDLDCDDTLDACGARLERLASVEVARSAVLTSRPVHLHLRRGIASLEAARLALVAAGFQVDVTARTLSLSGGPVADASARALDGAPFGGIRRVARGRYLVSRLAVERALGQQGALMRGARIMPATRDGRVVGVRVFAIRADELPARLGIQSGDVIRRVNGFDVATPERCLEAYSRLRQTSQVTVELERAGRAVTLVYEIV